MNRCGCTVFFFSFRSHCAGRLTAGLVREFLQFFELDFSCSVYDPETNVVKTPNECVCLLLTDLNYFISILIKYLPHFYTCIIMFFFLLALLLVFLSYISINCCWKNCSLLYFFSCSTFFSSSSRHSNFS